MSNRLKQIKLDLATLSDPTKFRCDDIAWLICRVEEQANLIEEMWEILQFICPNSSLVQKIKAAEATNGRTGAQELTDSILERKG